MSKQILKKMKQDLQQFAKLNQAKKFYIKKAQILL